MKPQLLVQAERNGFVETNVEFNWNGGRSEDNFNSEFRSYNSKNISLSIPIGFGLMTSTCGLFSNISGLAVITPRLMSG